MSEILTMFAHRIDALYFQGKSGEEPPYALRYQYRNPDFALLEGQPGSVCCVVRAGTPAPQDWTRAEFGSYWVYMKEG